MMFFKSKPVPDEWSHLTPREVKLCRKAARKSDPFDRYLICKTAIFEGSFSAVTIILPQVGPLWSSHLFHYIFEDHRAALRDAVLPALSGLDADSQRSFLNYSSLVDNPEYLNSVLKEIADENVRARAVCNYLSPDSGPGDKALYLCCAYIKAGCNIHYEGGRMLKLAVQKGQFDLADKIIASGFDMASFGQTVYQKLVGDGASPEAINWFKRRAVTSGAIADDQVSATVVDGDFMRFGSDGVARVNLLPNGARLTTVFNFSAGQQLTYVSEGDHLSAPAMTNISATQSRQMLDQAIAAFLDQDGDPAVVAPFLSSIATRKPAVVPK